MIIRLGMSPSSKPFLCPAPKCQPLTTQENGEGNMLCSSASHKGGGPGDFAHARDGGKAGV